MPRGYHHERASRCQGGVRALCGPLVGSTGGYTGWVLGGLYRVPSRKDVPLLSGGYDSEAGPEALQGAGVVVISAAPRDVRHPPFGPGRVPAGPSLVAPRANPASWPIGSRFDLVSHKVSQKARVSPKYV